MIYYSSKPDNYLWYLNLGGKQKRDKINENTKFLSIFNAQNKKNSCFAISKPFFIPFGMAKGNRGMASHF